MGLSGDTFRNKHSTLWKSTPNEEVCSIKLDIFRNVLKINSLYKNGTSCQLQSDYLLLFSTNETRSYVPQINIDVKYMCHLVQFNSSTAKEILSNWKVSNWPRAVHPQKFPQIQTLKLQKEAHHPVGSIFWLPGYIQSRCQEHQHRAKDVQRRQIYLTSKKTKQEQPLGNIEIHG